MGAPNRPARGSEDPSQRLGVRRGLAVLATLGLLATTGCSATDDDAPGPAASGTPSAGPPPLRTDATLGVVSGKLARESGPRLKRRITRVVDAWLDAAYVGGDYPRADFRDAFPHFSRGARREARRDAALMSNAAFGEQLSSVRATKRRLRVDVLAVERRAVGITARFVLEMKLSGDRTKIARKQRVAGSLSLTFRDGEWEVFGYDVNRGKA